MRLVLLGLCAGAGLAVLSSAGSAADWYERGHGRPPVGNRVYICQAYMCSIVSPVELSGAEIGRIAEPLAAAADAVAEREALSSAVQEFEHIVGARIGTNADLPGMQFGGGKAGQMDCIDEATNTTSLLRLLAEQGYLKHHRVEQPAARGFFLDGRYPHATAVISELAGTGRWAIDSWPRANAEPPVIQELAAWKRSRGGAPDS